MIGENMIQNLIENFLERMREMESIKNPAVVHGFNLLKIGAIGERAKHGLPVMEAYGSSRKIPTFEDLFFIPAMIDKFPIDPNTVRTDIMIGKNSKKPLRLTTPIMPSAMAYGFSVTDKVKLAWGKGAALQGTANNSGDTGYYGPERANSKYYIVQYNTARFGNDEKQLKDADAIEIRLGQSASAGLNVSVDGSDMGKELAEHLGLDEGQSISTPITHPELSAGGSLKDIVDQVRRINPDVPVGVKIAAGHIEADLDKIIEASCDFVTIDGAGGGTGGSPEITINNIGIPLIYAIPRAHKYLQEKGVRDQIDIIATGGLRDAGDFLKVMALGADAMYSGEAALIATVYSQMSKVPVGTSPAELYLATGKYGDLLDEEEAASALANFLKASTIEMAMLAGAVGKDDIKKVTKEDMVAIRECISKGTGVPLAY